MKKYLKFLIPMLILAIAFPILAQTDPPIEPEPAFNWWTIVSGVLAVIATIFGTALTKVKKKITDFVNLGRQAVELLTTVSSAIGDNTVTKEEIAAIKAEIADVKAAWKLLWGKS